MPWMTAAAESGLRESTEYDGIRANSVIFRTLGAILIFHAGTQFPWRLLGQLR
jgi:hypothetical protein